MNLKIQLNLTGFFTESAKVLTYTKKAIKLTDLIPLTLDTLTMLPDVLISSGVANIVNWKIDLTLIFITL